MVEAFISGWKRAFDYVGRSSRPDFWWFLLAHVIVSVVLAVLTNAVSQLFSALNTLYSIAVIVPSLPLTIRRLRDMGKGWGWIFIGLIPIIGFIWQIVLLVQPSIPA